MQPLSTPTPLWAALSLILPAFTARLVPLVSSSDSVVRRIKLLTWYTVSLLASIHLAAALELAGIISRFDLRAVALIAVALAAAAYGLWGRRMSAPQPTAAPAPASLPLKTVFVGIAAAYALGAVVRFLTFPLSFDGNSYHLPLIASWLQSGSLALPPLPDWRFSLPANGDSAMLPWLATGWPSLTIVPNIAAGFVAANACFVAARRITGQTAAACCSAALFLSLPMVFFQTLANSIDLFGAAFLLTSVALIIEVASPTNAVHAERRSHALTAAAALGITGGTKTTLLVHVACAGLVLLLLELNRHRGALRASLKPVALILLTAAIPSVFWFARATLSTGNPIYPVRLPSALQLDLPGFAPDKITPKDYDLAFVDHRAEWWIHPWREWRRLAPPEIPYAPNFGLGMAFAAFAVPGFVFCLLRSMRAFRDFIQNRGTVDWTVPVLSLSVIALTAAWALAMNRVPRFFLPALGLTCILAAPLFERLWSRRNRVFPLFLAASVAAPLVISLIAVLPLAAWAPRFDGVDDRAEFYGIPVEMSRLPRGSVIVNSALRSQNYPLIGEDLQYRVISPIPNLPPEEHLAWLRAVTASADFLVAVEGTSDYVVARKELGEPSKSLSLPPSGGDSTWALWSLR